MVRYKDTLAQIKVFSPLFGDQKPGDDIIIMDIDQIIVGDVTDMINCLLKKMKLLLIENGGKNDPNSGNTVRLKWLVQI